MQKSIEREKEKTMCSCDGAKSLIGGINNIRHSLAKINAF